jgi:RNA polymerase sigma factor (sigma-70 family)
LRFLRHAASANEVSGQSDAALLRAFVSQRSEDAFAAILKRHGPLVFAVCLRTLRDNTDAEDAFQATFLVLTRKAGSIRQQETLPAWLHRVALNICRTIKLAATRRQAHERQAIDMSQTPPPDDVELRDWQSVLHEEVDQLPEKYRIAVVLCYLQGLTHEEAGRRLGWPLGSVKGRLARAREFLRTRLARRGLTLTGAALTTALAESATAAVPAALLGVTVRAALSFATSGAAAGVLSTRALALATGAVQTVTATKLIHAALLVFAAGVAALFGAGAYWKATGGFEATAQAGAAPQTPLEPGGAAVPEKKPVRDVAPAESKAVRVNDVDFQAVIDGVCHIPAAGAKEPVSLGVRVSNRGEKTLLFNLFDTLRLGLETADGTMIRYEWRRFRTSWPPPIVLGKGETKTIKLGAWLECTKEGAVLSLAGTDQTAGFWHFDGLAAGKYRLHCEYENDRDRLQRFLRGGGKPFQPEKGQEFWFGAAVTPAVEFEILAPKKAAAAPSRRLEDQEDLNKLEGTWHMVACEEGGKLLAPENTNPNDFLTFEGTKLYFKSGVRGLRGVVTIDPSKNPKWMDHTFTDGKLVYKGIYDLKGDKLRLFMGLPGGERPTAFKTKEGEKLWLRTFERVKPPVKPPAPKAAEKEKDKAALWTPRVLGAGAVPLPDQIVQSDIVVLGRVVALEPKDVEAVFSSESPYKLDYRMAVVKVQEVIHGQKDVKQLHLGFISPAQDRKVDKTGKAMPALWPLQFNPVKVGQEGMFFLGKHHQGNFYVNFVLFGGFLPSDDTPELTKNLENARRLENVLQLPLEALKVENESNRFLAATMLVSRYRLSWLKDRKLPEKAIAAEESKLILKTLAEADWSDSTEALCPSKYPTHPYQVFLQLGVTKADGYDPPKNAPDFRDTLRYTQNWLRDNQEKYRIQRFTSSK